MAGTAVVAGAVPSPWARAAGIAGKAAALTRHETIRAPGGIGRRPGSPAAPATYYIAIGASESVGIQPTPGHHHGRRTNRGYANDLTAIERGRWPGLRLRALGCPGITVEVARRGGGHCHYAAGSQVRAAVDILRAHRRAAVLATVDLGFNDLWPCLEKDKVDRSCVDAAVHRVGRVVTAILRQVRAAGGPRLHVIGVLHNDPYLGEYLAGRRGRAFAIASVSAIDALNRALADAYTRAGILSADVPAAFATGDHRLVDLRGHGRVPTDVARMCSMSWMCAPPPLGENIHPNTDGYRAIAGALAAALAGTLGHPRAPANRRSLPVVRS